jgi:AbrB family looped-hinge helix DNA binding protein
MHHSKIIKGGKVALPAELRRRHGLGDGDRIVIEEVDGGIRIRSYQEVVRDVQRWVRSFVPEGVSLSDELIAERRAEAARE